MGTSTIQPVELLDYHLKCWCKNRTLSFGNNFFLYQRSLGKQPGTRWVKWERRRSFDRLIKLEVQLDPNFSRGHFVQQQPAVCGAFALHLLLYGRHGNLCPTEEILTRQRTFSVAAQKTQIRPVPPRPALTVWRELVFLEHGDAQDVLVEVSDEEVAVEVPLWVQGVTDGAGGVTLRSHGQLAVRVALPCRSKLSPRGERTRGALRLHRGLTVGFAGSELLGLRDGYQQAADTATLQRAS